MQDSDQSQKPMGGRATYGPNLNVVPVDDGVDAHKLWPACVCGIKVCKELAMRVRPPCTQKHRLDGRPVLQIRLEGRAHGQRIPLEVQVVLLR